MPTNAFDQADYWIRRHLQYPGEPKTVGNLNLSNDTNIIGRIKAIETSKYFIGKYKSKNILDIGCGFGDLCEAALAFDIHYTGIDISPIAIEFAKTRYPNHIFAVKNIIEWHFEGRYELIFCVNTLSYIINEHDWLTILYKLISILTNDGSLIIIDDVRMERCSPADHIVARTFLDYEAVLAKSNFRFMNFFPGNTYEDQLYPKDLLGAIVGSRLALSRSDARAVDATNAKLKLQPLKDAGLSPSIQGNAAFQTRPGNLDVATARKPTMLVVSWDMSDCLAERGYTLANMAKEFYEVEFCGPIFPHFGREIWSPLKNQKSIKITTFCGAELGKFFREAMAIVENNNPSVVYVSKPRLPSLLIGVLFKLIRGTPVIVDIDDHELSFCADSTPLDFVSALALAKAQPAAALMPFADIWTRFTENLIEFADSITVSTPALQQKFGGIVVRHARSGHLFGMDLEVRKRIRAEFSLLDTDIAVVFVGTPLRHKGIFRIARALERLDNPNLVFIVVGSIGDLLINRSFDKYKKARIRYYPDQPWTNIKDLISMADIVPVIRDIGVPITEFQISEDLMTAISMGIPVIATPIALLDDLIKMGIVMPIDNDETLYIALSNAVGYDVLDTKYKNRLRSIFASEFSYEINSARIKMAVDVAKSCRNVRPVTKIYNFVVKLAEHLEIKEGEIHHMIYKNKTYS